MNFRFENERGCNRDSNVKFAPLANRIYSRLMSSFNEPNDKAQNAKVAFPLAVDRDLVPVRPPGPPFLPGWVWLTGAGPGDPGLLTLHALDALATCDIIYHDALVSQEVLALAPSRIARVNVGKRGGAPSPRQADITALLIASAREGKRVVRLKGGDPMVFGRGAEEALELSSAGIPFRIIPGVTAGLGGLAAAGLPVSHRDFNQSITLVTAHDASGQLSEQLDWHALARHAPVLIIYMGYRLIGRIADRLIACGRAPETPVGVVSNATLAEQRALVSSLAKVRQDLAGADIRPPVMIMVGEIVRMKAAVDWCHGRLSSAGDVMQNALSG